MVHPGDADLSIAKFLQHPFSQSKEVSFAVIPSCNSGLICNYQEQILESLCSPAKVEDSFSKFKVLLTMQIPALNIDDTIAVQEECSVRYHRLVIVSSVSATTASG